MTLNRSKSFRLIRTTLLAIICIVGMTSCNSISSQLKEDYIEKSKAQATITKLKEEHQVEVKAATDKISIEKDKVINGLDQQLQKVADTLYGAELAFNYYVAPEPTRIDLIIRNRTIEASAATGKKPTADAMLAENKRLLVELDETKTSLEKLRKDHEIKVKEAEKFADKTLAHKAEVTRLEDALAAKNEKYRTDMEAAQNKVIAIQDQINLLEKKRSDEAEWIRSMKLKAMTVLGVLSLICVAAAIWSPVFRSKFVIGAAVMGVAAALVMYIQPWMIVAIVAVAILGVVVKIVLEHKVADTTATNLIGYVQDVKETNPSAHNKQLLRDWNGKYVKDGSGKVTTATDNSVESYIERKLKQTGRL